MGHGIMMMRSQAAIIAAQLSSIIGYLDGLCVGGISDEMEEVRNSLVEFRSAAEDVGCLNTL